MAYKISCISVIVPVYNEEANIEPFFNALKNAMDKLSRPYEVIFVDDASHDNSAAILKRLFDKNSNVKIVFLEKNYGQMAAILAASACYKGDVVMTMDCDLQLTAADAYKFLDKIEAGFDIVYGYRPLRKDPIFRKASSYLINKILNFKTGLDILDWGCSFCALKSDIIKHVLDDYGLNARFLKQIVAIKNKGNVAQVEVSHFSRSNGPSRYSFAGLVMLAADIVINISPKLPKKEGELFKIKKALSRDETNQ